jgi:hypothetical protein
MPFLKRMKNHVSVIVLSLLALKVTVAVESVATPPLALRFDELGVLPCAMNYAFGLEFVDVDRLEDLGPIQRAAASWKERHTELLPDPQCRSRDSRLYRRETSTVVSVHLENKCMPACRAK